MSIENSTCEDQADCWDLSGPVSRDTARLSQRYPPIARYGVFDVSTWPIGCDTPSPFSERFPWRACKVEVRYPPHKRGISAILARYPMKTRQNALCDTILKGYCAISYGGYLALGAAKVGMMIFKPGAAWTLRRRGRSIGSGRQPCDLGFLASLGQDFPRGLTLLPNPVALLKGVGGSPPYERDMGCQKKRLKATGCGQSVP